MNQGQTIISQVIDFLPKKRFRQCVDRYDGNHITFSFTFYEQFLYMAFVQLAFCKTKAAVKLHTLLDFRGNIPTFIWITGGKVHDVNVLDHLIAEPGSNYAMNRAYLDFQRLYQMHQNSAIFVTRSKTNSGLRRLYSNKVDKSTSVRCDQTVVPAGYYSKKDYLEKLRRVKYFDAEKGRSFVFLTISICTFISCSFFELF